MVVACELGKRFGGEDDRGRLDSLVNGVIGLEKPRRIEEKVPPFLL